MTARDEKSVGRRRFFRLVGTGVAAGAVVPLATEVRADGEKEGDKRMSRYRETDEVKTYYRVNRYPS